MINANHPMRGFALLPVSLLATQVPAQGVETLEEVAVYGRAQQQIGIARSASEGLVGYDDIDLPPLMRVGELVESVPGMVATQHSGTGKANQYFLRGFNLDHGTDFSVSVDGTPVNLRSHGHGQGYLDLNFLIPELVETTRYGKGPYDPAAGDFSSAGHAAFSLHEKLPDNLLQATLGDYRYRRGLAAGSVPTGSGTLTAALDATAYEGPWELEEDLRQTRAHLSYAADALGGRLRATLQAYDSEWQATDQIPRRAVDSGAIDRLGFIDPDLGGKTRRNALQAQVDYGDWQLGGYVVDYDFTLFSNFTYALERPADGDEFEQRDERRVSGLWARGEIPWAVAGRGVTLRWGSGLRHDDIDEVGLYATRARQRLDTVRRDRVRETSMNAHLEALVEITEDLRAGVGLRADVYDWQVNALRPDNSGSGDDALVTPTLNLAYTLGDRSELYASWGQGFHSNDVRGATISVDPVSGGAVDRVETLVGTEGAELGLRHERGSHFNVTLAAFWLQVDSELVYVGDAGSTEPNDGSERRGIEAAAFWQPLDWLALNAAWTRTHARFRSDQRGGRRIPGAVGETFTFGTNALSQNGLSASARLRYLGEAPLVEDNSVRSDTSWLLNAGIAYRINALHLRLDVFNVLDSDADDIAYYYASRLPGEPAGGVDDTHFHPLEPRAVRASIAWHIGN